MILTAEILAIYQELCESQEAHHNESETVLRLQQLIDETDMTWLQQFSDIKDNEAEVLILAKQMPRITNKDIRENVGIDMHQASTILKKFCKRGYLSKHGKSQNSYYILNDQYLTGISEPSTGISEPSMGGIEPSMGGIEPSMGGIEEVIADLSVLDNANSQLLLNSSLISKTKKKANKHSHENYSFKSNG